ncbi:MAG: chemotaxis protein CheB [Planctomycetota bacterium]|jgi:two-component system CheB/CheR fusion protein
MSKKKTKPPAKKTSKASAGAKGKTAPKAKRTAVTKKTAKKTTKKTGAKKSPGGRKPTAKAKSSRKSAKSNIPGPQVSPMNDDPANSKSSLDFPVAGMGASAGGLEALQDFFKAMPTDSRIAFVVVSHLDPKRISLMPELLQNCTNMKVLQAEENMQIQPDSVYVIPPNRDLAIRNGVLLLLKPVGRCGKRLAIDSFFRSLSEDQGENAICIILSGAGSDGSMGLREIRREAGMVMVQDPKTAKYDSMPRAALATDLCDFVLPPAEMPDQLIKYTKRTTHRKPSKLIPIKGKIPASLQKIYRILRSHTGQDFSVYKQNTICRRIERRMNVHQLDNISTYVKYLEDNPQEAGILFKELLIGVTNFFRDPDAFDMLKREVIPGILEGKPEDYALRVWVPGCSTGEEAYSIAILLQECMDEIKQRYAVQIFATDIDEKAIDTARAGVFPASISADVSPERLRRFFIKEDGTYVIKKDLRAFLTFAPQNLIKDPPFTKLDLLSCRNLLIYLDGESQKKLLPVFHYSLRAGGFLFLGTSETIGGAVDLFAPIDNKQKIFRRRESAITSHAIMTFPVTQTTENESTPKTNPKENHNNDLSVFRRVERCLLERYAPSCVVVDDKGEIIYVVHGQTGRYLDLAYGMAHLNILEMAKREVRTKLAAAIHKASSSRQAVTYRGLRVTENDSSHIFNLTVEPLVEPDDPPGLLVVVFERAFAESAGGKEKPVRLTPKQRKSAITQLQEELRVAKDELQTTIEVMDSSNEELKSTNEELQSTNEELQSSNEELETSKEEMQSLNEELSTVNAENEARINSLSHAYDDIRNLLDSTPFATVFVDMNLCVRRFTPKAASVINLIESDIDRPLSHIVSNLKYEDLITDTGNVIASLQSIEKEVEGKDGKIFSIRITPYRTSANVIDGAVITFDDISTRAKEEEDFLRLATVVLDAYDSVTVQDLDGRILAWNPAAVRMYGYSEKEALTMNISEIVPPDKSQEALKLVKDAAKKKIAPVNTVRLTKDGRTLDILLMVSRLVDNTGKVYAVATTERDITEDSSC